MPELKEPTQIPDSSERKTGLVVFGILQVILGGLSLLFVPMMIMGAYIASTRSVSTMEPMNVGQILPGAVMYLIMGVWLVWMGIGSIKARRWARALILVSSWLWLIGGINAIVGMSLFMSGMFDQMGGSGNMPPEMVTVVKVVMTGFMAIVFVVIPGVLVLFYSRTKVRRACENRDSRVRWTDKCPLPILALSGIFAISAVSMLGTAFTGWVMPFFGVILSGAAGAAVVLAGMVLMAYLAWGTYKLNIKTWWLAVIVYIGWVLSAIITFSRVSILDFFEKMNFSSQQLEMMKQLFEQRETTLFIYFGLWSIAILGYLLYTKKFFTPKPEYITPSTPANSP